MSAAPAVPVSSTASHSSLQSWEDIAILSKLPKLRELNLNGNKITSVARAVGSFQRLENLYMGSNRVTSWESVNSLHSFPAIQDVRLSGNPVVEEARGSARYETIARVAGLTQLNGSIVGAMERRDSEIRYIRVVEEDRLKAKMSKEEAAREHPRYLELSERFAGYLLAVGSSAQGTTSLASATANMKLTCVATVAGATMGTQEKKIPLSLTVDKVKLICERLFKVKVAEMLLYLRVSVSLVFR